MSLLSLLLAGFLLGMKHATEADHLAAVATLATRRGGLGDALRQGAAWGLGHTLALLLFGGVALIGGRSIPARLEQALELGVGLMLVGLGIDVLRRLRRQRVHFHAHDHGDGRVHLHAHSHREPQARAGDAVPDFAAQSFDLIADRRHRSLVHRHEHATPGPGRAVLVGVMHGMAGSAALVVLGAVGGPTVVTGLLYILLFGLGSILGMAALCLVMALPLRASAATLSGLHHGLTACVGAFSAGLGLWVVFRIGVLERLLLG